MNNYFIHSGIKGMKWGIRRYQNADGTLTALGRERYGSKDNLEKHYQERRERNDRFKDSVKRTVKTTAKIAGGALAVAGVAVVGKALYDYNPVVRKAVKGALTTGLNKLSKSSFSTISKGSQFANYVLEHNYNDLLMLDASRNGSIGGIIKGTFGKAANMVSHPGITANVAKYAIDSMRS